MNLPSPPAGVLFDLDGTILDSAPSLYAALQKLAAEQNLPPPPYAAVRKVVSRGARMILKTLHAMADNDALEVHRERYLALYEEVMSESTAPFDGMADVLDALERAGVPWGIVTNKAGYLTEPLLRDLGLRQRAASVVCGDTLSVAKPDPAPVLHACKLANIAPAQSIFVGDDARDIQAGRDAGLYTVAAAWGYLNGEDPHDWGADMVSATPRDLSDLLEAVLPA